MLNTKLIVSRRTLSSHYRRGMSTIIYDHNHWTQRPPYGCPLEMDLYEFHGHKTQMVEPICKLAIIFNAPSSFFFLLRFFLTTLQVRCYISCQKGLYQSFARLLGAYWCTSAFVAFSSIHMNYISIQRHLSNSTPWKDYSSEVPSNVITWDCLVHLTHF